MQQLCFTYHVLHLSMLNGLVILLLLTLGIKAVLIIHSLLQGFPNLIKCGPQSYQVEALVGHKPVMCLLLAQYGIYGYRQKWIQIEKID